MYETTQWIKSQSWLRNGIYPEKQNLYYGNSILNNNSHFSVSTELDDNSDLIDIFVPGKIKCQMYLWQRKS